MNGVKITELPAILMKAAWLLVTVFTVVQPAMMTVQAFLGWRLLSTMFSVVLGSCWLVFSPPRTRILAKTMLVCCYC